MAQFIDQEAAAECNSDHESDLSEEIPYDFDTTPKRITKRKPRTVVSSSEEDSDVSPVKEKPKRSKLSNSVLEELKKTNAIMTSLAEKVKKTERRVRAMEVEMKSQNSGLSSSSTPKRARKRDVPDEVRVSCSSLIVAKSHIVQGHYLSRQT